MTTRYYIRLPNPDEARGNDPELSFRSRGAEGFAEELQQALRDDALFLRWQARQEEPDDVDPALAATDSLALQGRQGAEQVGAQVPQGFDIGRVTQAQVHARHLATRQAGQRLQHGLAHLFKALVAHPSSGRWHVTARKVVQVVAKRGSSPVHGGGKASVSGWPN